MQDKIWDVLLKEEEIGWRSILYDLVKSEKMNPWDINITLLTQKYIQVCFCLSGKLSLFFTFDFNKEMRQ